MKKVVLLACGLSSILGCVGLMSRAAYAETASGSTVAAKTPETIVQPVDAEPAPPAEIVEVTAKTEAAKPDTAKATIASATATAVTPIAPKFLRVPMHSRIFPAMFQ